MSDKLKIFAFFIIIATVFIFVAGLLGGIIGYNKGSTCTFTITNCYNTGDITGKSETAAISGWLGTNATLQNCFSIGTITGYSYRNDFYRGSASAINCYATSTTQVNRITIEEAANGKLCYQLNSGMVMEPIWYQTIGSDEYPVFDDTHQVVIKADDGTYYNISHLAGDVDGNGLLEEVDANWIASYLTGETPEGFHEVNADANLDGKINVADIVTVRRIIDGVALGKEPLTANLYSSNATVKAGGTRKLTIWVNMSRPATAYEADIVLSEGLSVQDSSVTFSSRINTPSHMAYVLPNSKGAHIIVFAPKSEDFRSTSGTALTFNLVGGEDFKGGTYQISGQHIVTADGVVCSPEDASYEVNLSKTYVTSVVLKPRGIDIIMGNDTTLTVSVLPETATVKTLTWLTSDASIATVSDGIVTAIAPGTATIIARATDGSNQEGTATVNVYRDADGIIHLSSDEGRAETIYTLSGTRLDRITKSGIYIINGVKRQVKVE